MRTFYWTSVILLGLLIALAGLWAWGRVRWDSLTSERLRALEATRTQPQPTRYDAARELDGLPAPVQRYFRAALRDGVPIVAGARIEQTGSFNSSEHGEAWRPFTAEQRVVTRRPGFVWDARIVMTPGVAVHVHDAYVAGEGILHATLLGLVTLAEQRGGTEVAHGELMRWLAEAAWYPTALLPSQGLRWQPLDHRSARATVVDGGVAVALTFGFADDGLIESVRAEARGRTVGPQVIATPWEGQWRDYAWREPGLRVPMQGDVAWLLPPEQGGRKPYWRGKLSTIGYD